MSVLLEKSEKLYDIETSSKFKKSLIIKLLKCCSRLQYMMYDLRNQMNIFSRDSMISDALTEDVAKDTTFLLK